MVSRSPRALEICPYGEDPVGWVRSLPAHPTADDRTGAVGTHQYAGPKQARCPRRLDAKLYKNWYARLKSRPSFRPLLTETMAGIPPSKTYADLDF